MSPAPKARILVVDDEQGLRDMLRYSLTARGFEVGVAAGGGAALEMLRASEFEVALCDIMMPDMNGIETLKAIKELRPQIQVIMVTGYATLETAIEAMNLGAFDYVAKPYELDDLCGRLDRAVEHGRLRLKVAELEELSRLKSQMIVSLSRDMKPHLDGVFAELSRALQEAPPGSRRALGQALAGAQQLLSLLESILYYSRLDSGLLPPCIEPFDVDAALREAVEGLQGRALSKSIDLAWRAPSPLRLASDKALFKQILLILLGHAIDRTEEGAVSVEAEAAGPFVSVRVSDSGPAFSADEAARLFEPPRDPGADGRLAARLGLHVTKRLVELLGGTLRLEASSGRGGSFLMTLPAAGAPAARPARA